MITVKVCPRRLVRVARVYVSTSNHNLNALQPIGDLMLYVFYDPITKLYFTGSHSGVYSYYYTNVFEKAITYLKNIWQQYFVINSEITEFFGNNAELVVKNFHTIEQLVKLSGNTEKNILNTFILKVFPQQLVVSFITSTNKKKKKAYKLNPFYVQHNLVNV